MMSGCDTAAADIVTAALTTSSAATCRTERAIAMVARPSVRLGPRCRTRVARERFCQYTTFGSRKSDARKKRQGWRNVGWAGRFEVLPRLNALPGKHDRHPRVERVRRPMSGRLIANGPVGSGDDEQVSAAFGIVAPCESS